MKPIRRGDQFGSWTFVAALGGIDGPASSPARGSERWLVLDERHQTNHLVHIARPLPGSADQRRFIERVGVLARCQHAHLPRIQAYSFTPDQRPFVVTPYPGTHEGIMTLREHIDRKGGRLPMQEAERAIEHLLSALRHAHETLPDDFVHGPFDADDVLVDRNGSLIIDNYALRAVVPLASFDRVSHHRADEIRSLVKLAYEMITGQRATAPMIPAGKLCPRIDRRYELWLTAGLDPALGFETIAECHAALHEPDESGDQTRTRDTEPQRTLRPAPRPLTLRRFWGARPVVPFARSRSTRSR